MAIIDLDLTIPTNALRAIVGDIDPDNPIMSDSMYQQIYDMNDINGRQEAVVLWFSAIQAASILLSHYASTAGHYRERVNAVEIEESGGEKYRNFLNLLKWLRNNPPTGGTASAGLFHFGGTYTQCDLIYTLRYIKDCMCSNWPNVVVRGYRYEAIVDETP